MIKQLLTFITCLNLVLVGHVAFAQQDAIHDHQDAVTTNVTPPVQPELNHQHQISGDDSSSHALDHAMPVATESAENHDMHHEPAQVMDHDMHQEPAQVMDHDMHQEPAQLMDHDMDHAAMGETDQPEMRDPHAYSDGYGLTTGPYLQPSQRKIVLADEKTFTGLWMDRFEFVQHDVMQGGELEGFAWFGNSYRQIIVQAQMETLEGTVEEGEIDVLYSTAVSPFWDLRYGAHRSFGENADRDWAAIGFKGLAPYWFEIDASLHIGNSGHAAFDFEAEYELLLTQRLVLQPRIDIMAFSKTDVDLGRGSGLSTIKTGARLRYELDRQFAPYLGVEHVSRYGETADLMPIGRNRTETHWVLGLKFWF